jgi:hypothetical protein
MSALTQAEGRTARRSLALLGVLWLLLAAAIVVVQRAIPAAITVEWQTETEVNTAGFNVYRALSPEGPYELLNGALIASRGSARSGSSYSYTDQDVAAGQTYYYRLEDVELDNSATQHEAVAYTAPAGRWWVPAAAALSVLAGLTLLVKGLR